MDDLRRRFATLDALPVPDVWSDVERRSLALSSSTPTRSVVVRRPSRGGSIGDRTPGANGVLGRRRGVGFIIVAALVAALLIGGAIVVGSALSRLTSEVPPAPSLGVSRVVAPLSPSPDVSPIDNPPPSPLATVRGSGSWSLTGRMTIGRLGGTATLLPDGRVLVVGGWPGDRVVSTSAELYDPISGRWTETGSMLAPRSQGHSATLLPGGKVLVAGGDSLATGHLPQGSAELYDPATGSWVETGSMTLGRSHHSATLLPDGKVLIAGGTVFSSDRYRASKKAEVYDPATGTWTSSKSMTVGRADPTAALLPDGKVLVIAGSDADTPGRHSAEVYDPRAGTWAGTLPFDAVGSCRIATSLSDGQVLVVCAEANGTRTAAALYDPASGSWSLTGSPPKACCLGEGSPRGSIVRLTDGRVLWKDLVDPGELYEPATGTWTSAGGPTYPADPSWELPYTGTDEGNGYYADTLTLLRDGTVLMTTMGVGLLYDPNGGP